ncbi:PREDICTED: uncharacterized protein LOC104818323 [Tarenaya hassleriana]|uniref:uncharacterized protein LOC104818323 n=1 Tax=Tarenaya hassleriana TaxID=28532 RepID=UPI00053C18F1|nr:PREDICTED: uncharacterized protein LOC104818323 [Tarenaya hassleriana]
MGDWFPLQQQAFYSAVSFDKNPRGSNSQENPAKMAEEDDLYWVEQPIGLPIRRNKTDWPMVVIKDSAGSVKDDLSVFPPINHENLQVSSITDGGVGNLDSPSPSESSSPVSSSQGSALSSSFSLSPSDSNGQPQWTAADFDPKSPWKPSETDGKSPRLSSDLDGESPPSDAVAESPRKPLSRSSREVDVVHCWWKLLLLPVLSKLRNTLTWFSGCNFSSIIGTLRSLYPVLAIATLWWTRVRTRRRRCKGETMEHLRNVIKEKDERIVQLLHQIAQVNELLVKHHKNVISRLPN